MADVLGLIMSISELCSIAANKVQDVRDIEKDCIELNALLRRLKQLLDDAVVELDEQQLNKASAIEALEALKGTMQLCLDVITDLSKKSWLWKLLRSGEHVASIKSVTLQISRDLTTLNTALGMEQHADLKRAMKKLQIDLENVSLKVMRGFQAQAAQLQEQFEQVRKELNANGPTSTAAKDPVALLSNAVGILDSSKSVRPKEAEEICAALREEMESMRREKQNMHEGYLSQLMEAYSLVAKGSLSSGPSTSAPWAHSAQVAELEVPDEYRCPITLRVMSDPVKLVESGHSFERTAIEMHLSSSCINPLTRLPLKSKTVVPDIDLHNAIDMWLSKHGLTRAQADVSVETAPRQKEAHPMQLMQKEPVKLKRFLKGHERIKEGAGGSSGTRSISAAAQQGGRGGQLQHELQVSPGACSAASFTAGSEMVAKERNSVKGLCAAALRQLGGLLPGVRQNDCGKATRKFTKGAREDSTRHRNSASDSGPRGGGISSTGGNRDASRAQPGKMRAGAHPKRSRGRDAHVQPGSGCMSSDSSVEEVLPDSSSSDEGILPDSSSSGEEER